MSARPASLNWIAAPLAVALGALLVAVVREPAPPLDLPAAGPATNEAAAPFRPAADLRRFFAPPQELPWDTNRPGPTPFFTAAIRPPAAPVAPPPPTTKKVPMLYQGHMETSLGVRLALVRAGDAARLVRLGDEVAGGWVAADIAHAALAMTNAAGQAVKLPFRVPQEVEVPVK